MTDFPFNEIGRFDTLKQALDSGYAESQIWSVVSGDDDNVFVYGPAFHYVNRLHFVVTTEHHNGNTYFEEELGEC